MTRANRLKIKMMAMIGFSLISVASLAVATYAWFVALPPATFSSGTLTVEAPPDVEVTSSQVFMYVGDASAKTVDSDYTQLDLDAAIATRTVEGLNPGDTVTFAVKVTASTIATGTMDLIYRSYSLSNRTIRNSSPAKVVNMRSAIQISTGANGTGAYPSMGEALAPLARGSEYALSSLTQVGSSMSYYKQDTVSNAINGASIGNTVGYFFYTIKFVNTEDTFYLETDSGGNAKITTPKSDASSSSGASPTPVTRYFTGSDSGSSTCYEGLKFSITKVAIKLT